MGYTHIDEKERRRIERALKTGKSLRKIAKALDRSVSNISEEVRRGGGRDTYRADRAQEKAVRTRKNSKIQCLKVAMDPELKRFVTREIEHDQSPEAVAGRLRYVEVIAGSRIIRRGPFANVGILELKVTVDYH